MSLLRRILTVAKDKRQASFTSTMVDLPVPVHSIARAAKEPDEALSNMGKPGKSAIQIFE